jgi:hypothetical protein
LTSPHEPLKIRRHSTDKRKDGQQAHCLES